jgi:glycosyltransferase involved in cell wall biosynthesis
VEPALLAGCKKEKILVFPFVFDVERLKTDAPEMIPKDCIVDKEEGVTIIFFSGRMIPRKGLPTLLAALSTKTGGGKWVLWIEGDGPELEQYKSLAQEYGIQEHCRFLGFCQHDLHSWLIRSSDIVVVPSLRDNWALVVDEGMQLGRAVITTDATGAGHDRVLDGHNGYIFPAGDAMALANSLEVLIDNPNQRVLIGNAAMTAPRNIRPADNLVTILKLIKK